jgi:hypothetical protein
MNEECRIGSRRSAGFGASLYFAEGSRRQASFFIGKSAMPDFTIASVRYRIEAVQREGRWVATAVRADSGGRFGSECAGDSAQDAERRMAQWIEWQHEHAQALEALQQAESAYHRTIAGSAFASPFEGPSPVEMQKESLDALEAARQRLDEVRARRPQH